MLLAWGDAAGRWRMQSFPGGQTGVRQWSVSALTSLACPSPLRRSLSPGETANLESLIAALLEGRWTAGLCVGSFKLVLGCLCHFRSRQ
jgi:hypothetical protein